MKQKKNRRTLRKRISRLIYLSSLLNIAVFSIAFLLISIFLLRPVTEGLTNYISSSIARDMNSQRFLNDLGLTNVEDFDEKSPKASEWINNLKKETSAESFMPFMMASGPDLKADPDSDVVFVRIVLGDRTVYSNITETNYQGRKVGLMKLVDWLNIESTHPILNASGNSVGHVSAGMNPNVLLTAVVVSLVVFLVLVLVTQILNLIISRLFAIPVIKPLSQLEETIRAIAKEDYDATRNTKIVLRRPMREIESLADSTNTIMQKMASYNQQMHEQKNTLEDQNEELEAQNEELSQSKRKIQEAQEQVMQREKALRNLLNNAGQGFLTFGGNLTIDEEYSLECEQIFGREIGGLTFPELLGQYDAEQTPFLHSILTRLFQEKDAAKRSLYFPLLTDEINAGGKHIHIDYKIIHDPFTDTLEKFMVILTDITEKRALQSQVEAERNTLTMVVKVVVNYSDFNECAREFGHFYGRKVEKILTRDDSLHAKLLDIYRDAHTFKGNFSQLGLIHVVSHLHQLENELTRLIRDVEHLSLHDLRAFMQEQRMQEWLQEDITILSDILGDAFFQQEEAILIDKTKLLDIEKKMLSLLSPVECKLLVPELRKLRFKPFKDLLRTYPEYVAGLAERMDKLISPFEIQGEEFVADTDKYYDLSRSLIHVFRNVVDHGIEQYDDRMAADKDEYGQVRCAVALEEDRLISLVIADDGRGIDIAEIRTRAVEKGLYDAEAVQDLSDDEALALIFHDEFSTKEEITELSGRGMGLSAVRYEIERLGGRIDVHTKVGEGTEFRFLLPYEGISELPHLHVPTILEALTERTETFFAEYIDVNLEVQEDAMYDVGEKLHLNKVTSFIAVKGAIEGLFAISMDKPLSHTLLRRMIVEALPAEEEDQYVEDSLAEAANIILGNSIRKFKGFEEILLMDPPTTIHTEGASVRYADSEIWARDLTSTAGSLRLCFILSKSL